MIQLIINWLAEKWAQFIKGLQFFLQCVFLAITGGGVPSYTSIPDPRRIVDQYLLGKCKAVPFQDFLFTERTLSIIILTNWGGGGGIPGNSWWGEVCCLALQILTQHLISDQYL